jgi:hypothetical protein
MGRPKGSKNRSTILREAQQTMVSRGLLGHEQDFLDSLAVMEEGMRHFYVRAISGEADEVARQGDRCCDDPGGADRGEDRAVSARAFERREAGR